MPTAPRPPDRLAIEHSACAKHFVAGVLTAIVLTGGSSAAQSVSGPELKAALLFNLAQFVEWPAEAEP